MAFSSATTSSYHEGVAGRWPDCALGALGARLRWGPFGARGGGGGRRALLSLRSLLFSGVDVIGLF